MGILYDLRQYHLHKAQTKFDNITNPPKWKVISHLRNTEFQVQFERTQHNGRFRTHANIVRGQKLFHGNHRGLIHRAVSLKYRVNGDIPSVTKTLDSLQPKILGGKTLKKSAQAVNFIAHDASQTVIDTALASEDITLKLGDTAVNETKTKLKQKYTREAVDDYHRGLFFMGRTSVDAVKGTRQHFKLKQQHKLEKAKFKLKKAEFSVYHHDNFKPKLRKVKADFRLKKRKFQQRKRAYRQSQYHSGINREKFRRRKQEFQQTKREYQFELKKLKTTHKFRKKELNIQKNISRNSNPGLLALKPVKYSAKRMTASAWQKALNEDSDNDFMRAADSAKRRIIEPTVQKVSRPERLQRSQKSRDKTADKKLKTQQKLHHQENKLKSHHNDFKHKKHKRKSSFSAELQKTFRYVKNVYAVETKRFFGTIALPILIIFLVFAFILMTFSSILSGGGFTLGTYASQDYDLSEAEKYYTQLAWNFNQNLIMVGDSNKWKKGLKNFGIDVKSMKDKPDSWIFGKSDVYDWTPDYDFDTYKLWSFLCAYYYNFDSKNGDIKYWKFTETTASLLDELFKSEYEFVYWYDNKSRWEYRYNFDFRGYYSIEGSGVSGKYGYINISYPDALPMSGVTNGKTLYFDLSNGEVLNYNDEYSATGWYLKNQFADDYDNSGTKFGAWYTNGETCSYGIWEDGVLTIPMPYIITENNWCSFLKKYDWKTDCRLYYSVKQKNTFDKVIENKLKSMSHSDERLQYYQLLVGEDSGKMYGNHQTLKNILDKSVIDCEILNGFGYDMQNWNEQHCQIIGLHEGIDIKCSTGEKLYAPFDCKIKQIDTDKNTIVLRKDDVTYWYDGTGGTKRDTEVYLTNTVLTDGLKAGDTIRTGEYFASVTNYQHCDNLENTGENYIHLKVKIDTDGFGWNFIDPRLVLY